MAIIVGLLLGTAQIVLTATGLQSDTLIVSEFLAVNGTGLTDEDGDHSDWIEIHNRSGRPVSLAGWSLTDNPDQPQKWTFPDITLGGHDYLLVFASGKNRKSVEPESQLHTNFKLNQAGEFLGLYNIFEQRFVDQVSPRFPEQYRDISYGRYDDDLSYGYFPNPTAGQSNDQTSVWKNLVANIQFSVERGIHTEPFSLALSTATAEATIFYTTDGSQPTESNGIPYTEPFIINSTTVLRAAAFKPHHRPSYVETHSYIFLDEVLKQPANPSNTPPTWGTHIIDFAGHSAGSQVMADYEMDPDIVDDPRFGDSLEAGLQAIPTLSIVAQTQQLYELYANPRERGETWERPVSVELIDPDGAQPGFQINAGLRIQGGVGRWEYMPKHSFRLFFKGAYGATKLEYPVFPDSVVESFDTLIIRGGVNRSYAGRPRGQGKVDHSLAVYSRDEWLRASQIAMSGVGSHGIFVHLYLNGLYWGLYNVVERPDASFSSAYLGGTKEDWGIVSHSGPVSGSIERFDMLHQLATEGNLADPDKYATIQSYIDTTQFSDYVILNWYAGNRDWGDNNWYAAVRNPVGQVNYFVWDAENSWDNGAKIYLGNTEIPERPNLIKPLFDALIQNPDFKITFADRMYKHLFNNGPLTDANSQARWKDINAPISQAIIGESARWGDVRNEIPLNPDDWQKAYNKVLGKMEGNSAKLIRKAREDGYYPEIDPPRFNQNGGTVSSDFTLTMMASAGVIYYTTDGSDPRAAGHGAIAPNATLYTEPLVLTTTTTIKTRAFTPTASTNSDHLWSALHEATFTIEAQVDGLQITEIMYNPVGGSAYEFIELKNTGETEIDLSGVYFQGIRFIFPPQAASLSPGEFIVLVRDPEAFSQRYPGISIGGVYSGQLSNKGERVTLKDRNGNAFVTVAYDDENGWPVSPDGSGDSLVLINSDEDPNDPQNWQASFTLHGAPGE